MLARIDDGLFHTYRHQDASAWLNGAPLDEKFVGALTVLDAWGTPVYATHPGRTWTTDDEDPWGEADPDGTIHTLNEESYGVALNRQVVFVSAGPDRLFGIPREFLHLSIQQRHEAKGEARRDNLYTQPVVFKSY